MLDAFTTAFLLQDGLTSGLIYALLALSLILVFTVTRVLFIAQGELVAFAALTMAALEQGRVPGTVYVLFILGVCCFLLEGFAVLKTARRNSHPVAATLRRIGARALQYLVVPGILAGVIIVTTPMHLSRIWTAALTIALVTMMGPMLYRLVFQRIADSSLLALLFVSVAVHYVLLGIGLSSFGAEGWRTQAFSKFQFAIGALSISGQTIIVWCVVFTLILLLWLFFQKSYPGRVLIATARNRKGAKLVGIRPELAGKLAFGFAAAIGALSGILISPTLTFYYDSGFLIVLKGLVAAVIGAMASYPLAMVGAMAVGTTESFAAYFASTFKEAIVFLLLVPFLLWMSLRTKRTFEADED
ncbi:MAG: branched-chain amino acid ABC transporter permease [Pseudomonadota bacterium]